MSPATALLAGGLLATAWICAAAAASPAPVFRFSDPPGPQFSESEKQAQREHGAGIPPRVRAAFDGGAAEVVLPPGDYRFGAETWGPDGPRHPLEFRGMRRDAAHPFRIVAEGVTLWFDLPPDQAPRAHFAMGFVECSHVALEGATLDRDPRGVLEGRITAIDDAGGRIEIEATPGSSVPESLPGGLEQRVIPFNADGTLCAALYEVQLRGPVRLAFRGLSPGTAPGRHWVEFDPRSELLRLNRDPEWVKTYGAAGTLQPGDGLCLLHATTVAISVRDCERMTFTRVRNHIPKGMVRELGGAGGHLWTECHFGPRPGTCQWQGGDGVLTGCMERGSVFERITMTHTTDDLMDIHGFWGYPEKVEGPVLTLQRDHQMPAAAGDRLNFFDRRTGAPAGQATVVSVTGQELTLDRDAGAFAEAVAENPARQNNGWAVRDSTFIDCYQRFLVQGGAGGVLSGNRFIRCGSRIELHSNFFTRNEGGICRDITIEDNLFEDVAIHPRGVTIAAGFEPLSRKAAQPLVTGLRIRNNTFVRPGGPAVRLADATRCEVSGNVLRETGSPPGAGGAFLQLEDCVEVVDRDNRTVPTPAPSP